MKRPMKQIFISYSRHDLDIVKPIIRQIESKVNVKCWIDWDGIESGSQFKNVIVKAIDAVDTVVFFVSNNSMRSHFIQLEIEYAQNTGKRVIPIILDGGTLRGWFLFTLGSIDYIDIKNKLQFNKLISNLQSWYGAEEQEANNVTVNDSDNAEKQAADLPHKSSFWSKLLRPKYLTSLACVLVIGLALGCYQIFFSSDSLQPTPQPTPTSDNTYIENVKDLNMKMIYVKGGTFIMGASSGDSDAYDHERPAHQVTLDSYYIAEFEVTQFQWQKIMGSSINNQIAKSAWSNTYGVGNDYPVYYVSWEEANEFCDKLSSCTGMKYRLPTEAEWEFAARGGNAGKNSGNKYSGSSFAEDVAWSREYSESSAHLVGQKQANELGLYDMSGNVWEWCMDDYDKYSSNNQTNPIRVLDDADSKVLRGGSWCRDSVDCRVSFRSFANKTHRGSSYGFRVVCLP